eukprot:s4360_g12.t1
MNSSRLCWRHDLASWAENRMLFAQKVVKGNRILGLSNVCLTSMRSMDATRFPVSASNFTTSPERTRCMGHDTRN